MNADAGKHHYEARWMLADFTPATRDEWMTQGACVERTDLFFPDGPGDKETIVASTQICATCPVRERCAEYAIETNQQYGIWGGFTMLELHDLRRRRVAEIPPVRDRRMSSSRSAIVRREKARRSA